MSCCASIKNNSGMLLFSLSLSLLRWPPLIATTTTTVVLPLIDGSSVVGIIDVDVDGAC
jgi:hypothetical protein